MPYPYGQEIVRITNSLTNSTVSDAVLGNIIYELISLRQSKFWCKFCRLDLSVYCSKPHSYTIFQQTRCQNLVNEYFQSFDSWHAWNHIFIIFICNVASNKEMDLLPFPAGVILTSA